ncbi:MAG: ribose-5-phosphate isomerase RpiA, partial [Firmicutes bacterium]|nr:ribose-5-phosphate isomerase RpiA [Bacillota bacterium]
GMTIGLGTGSTAYWAIQKLGERVAQGLRIRAIGTSKKTEDLARAVNIPLVTFAEVKTLDLDIDGADEVSACYALTKGGGGALLREKLVASAARRFIVIVDQQKMVDRLGKFLLPVEVVPFAWELTQTRVEAAGCRSIRRQTATNEPFVTDNGNYILDCDFGRIDDPKTLHETLIHIPGLVETGLFVDMAAVIVVSDGKDVQVQTIR